MFGFLTRRFELSTSFPLRLCFHRLEFWSLAVLNADFPSHWDWQRRLERMNNHVVKKNLWSINHRTCYRLHPLFNSRIVRDLGAPGCPCTIYRCYSQVCKLLTWSGTLVYERGEHWTSRTSCNPCIWTQVAQTVSLQTWWALECRTLFHNLASDTWRLMEVLRHSVCRSVNRNACHKQAGWQLICRWSKWTTRQLAGWAQSRVWCKEALFRLFPLLPRSRFL